MITEGVLSLQNVVVYMKMVEKLAKYNLYTKICSIKNVEQLKYIFIVFLVMPI